MRLYNKPGGLVVPLLQKEELVAPLYSWILNALVTYAGYWANWGGCLQGAKHSYTKPFELSFLMQSLILKNLSNVVSTAQ